MSRACETIRTRMNADTMAFNRAWAAKQKAVKRLASLITQGSTSKRLKKAHEAVVQAQAVLKKAEKQIDRTVRVAEKCRTNRQMPR